MSGTISIGGLTQATSLGTLDMVPLTQASSGITRKASLAQIGALVGGGGGGSGTFTTIVAGSHLSGGTITTSGTIGFQHVVTNTYSASGTISVNDDVALVNNASGTIALTLASGSVNGHLLWIKQLGTATATIAATLDGTAQTLTLNGSTNIKASYPLAWNSTNSTWLVQ